ncbi:MAG: hypothetical protein OJF49_002631 [Ktedonobacterales bacterium]|jgi:hypothetical protein|nr:MAG: hypothetical protein OJF49_002631 [Ktedonobacterales bacterium]
MPYNREVPHSRDELIRDILFLYHECANYGTIYGNNNYWTLLRGPYYEFFDEGEDFDAYAAELKSEGFPDFSYEDGGDPLDPLIRVGSVLLFISMLENWHGEDGYPFGTYEGECRHPLPTYVRRLLHAYRRVRTDEAAAERPVYAAALSICAALDKASQRAQFSEELHDEVLLAELRAVIREDQLGKTDEQLGELKRWLYTTYMRAYFLELSQR